MSPRRSHRRARRGFTLIELLLVVLILAILGSAVGVSIFTVRRNAFQRTARAQVAMLEEAAQMYFTEVGQYPQELSGLYTRPSNLPNPDKWQGPYLDKQIPADPWDVPYNYEVQTDEFNRQKIVITSYGPDRQAGTADDVSNYDPD